MIQFTNINKQFDNFKVLKEVNLHLGEKNIIALIGPNACGKTTLIKCLLGMVIPNSGEIFFMDKPIKGQWEYRHQIGYMPQIARYPENMKVGHVLEMIEDLRDGRKANLDKELYDSFNLKNILNKRMGTLSGGTRQKVSAYLAFLFDPAVLILDEPTAGLDPVASLVLKDKILKEKEKGKLILVTSHILSELDEVINQIVYMEEGRIIFCKPIEDVKKDTGKVKLTEAIAQIMSANNQNLKL
ncbi:MAG: ABC transporter ATP-binding protein [Bacteroidia bacterium]|nr:ABC transporter ATP-binding protein [Bacteroidia bacterium]MCO5253239.1 ABC transporter ATP-binding protein [Bacteroidota bacterium]MCZ2130545.1 ABC transporter ATP-binding protein [Bacteroidia bacterium]